MSRSLAIRGVVFNWMGRGSALAIALVVTPILITGLGDAAYGMWAVAMSLTNYYALADMGLRSACVKYIAQFHARRDFESIHRVLITGVVAYGVLAFGVLLMATAAAFAFPIVIGTGGESAAEIRLVVFLTGVTLGLRIAGQPFASVLVALKRFDLSNMLAVGAQVTQAVLVVTVVRLGGGLLGMACMTLLVASMRQVVQLLCAIWQLGQVSFSLRYVSFEQMKSLFGFGWWTMVANMSRRVVQSGGRIVIAAMMGPAAATFYTLAETLVEKVAGLTKGVTSVVMPVASQLDAEERPEALSRVLLVVTRNLLAMTLCMASIFIALGYSIIEVWIGADHARQAYGPLCLLSLAMALKLPSNGPRSILTGTGQLRFLAWISVLEILITLGVGIVLVKTNGLMGMAWATLLGQVVTSGFLLPRTTCKRLDIPLRLYVYKGVLPGVLAAVPGAATAILIASVYPPTHLLAVGADVCAIVAITAMSAYAICLDESERRAVSESLLPRFRFSRRHGGPAVSDKR